ncbi:hypothetical protein SAMN04488056_104123 [Cohaesibacter marisflavi]|uniref:Uncharacterized protein n=1 Tax=Cohaesibacter marisflavi TaxID=655353 RepID=A0A1I5FMV9_9HYPH|nr:hypothetical protein SAMN04488056_104123 [Cohaesibacter marisflavi]
MKMKPADRLFTQAPSATIGNIYLYLIRKTNNILSFTLQLIFTLKKKRKNTQLHKNIDDKLGDWD